MSADATPRKLSTIKTARVSRAYGELVEALVDAARQSSLTRNRAQGKLSALIADLWVEADRRIGSLPLCEQD